MCSFYVHMIFLCVGKKIMDFDFCLNEKKYIYMLEKKCYILVYKLCVFFSQHISIFPKYYLLIYVIIGRD